MNDKFAGIELTNYHFMLREMNQAIYGKLGFIDRITMMTYKINTSNMGEENNPRKIVKMAIKKRIPNPIWKVSKKIYHLFGGKKWIG